MSKIERLTSEQEALIPVIRDEWLAHGLSTEPADREEAARGIRDAYREAAKGRALHHRTFWWWPIPASVAAAIAVWFVLSAGQSGRVQELVDQVGAMSAEGAEEEQGR